VRKEKEIYGRTIYVDRMGEKRWPKIIWSDNPTGQRTKEAKDNDVEGF
jgi:hypothetical protein